MLLGKETHMLQTVDPAAIGDRVAALAWTGAAAHLDAYGWAMIEQILTADECRAIAGLYEDDRRFRSHVVMARHGFGRGEYKYFRYPLPDLVADLRTALYARLAPLANRWNEALGIAVRYPEVHATFVERCHQAGQTRPTPLCCGMARATTTASTRTCMASTSSRSRWRSSWRSPGPTSPAASSCSPSSGRACSRGWRWCRSAEAMA